MATLSRLLQTTKPIALDFIANEQREPGKQFNLFKIISQKWHRENFHSDVIAYFLDPNEGHGMGTKPLELFINLLRHEKPDIAFTISPKTKVTKETAHVDVAIINEDSPQKEIIIIENKINDAIDQPRQLITYYDRYANEGYAIRAIVYLSIDGFKRPEYFDYEPHEIETVRELLVCLKGYHERLPSVFSRWIKPLTKETNNPDVISALSQYAHLYQIINKEALDYENLDQLYQQIGGTTADLEAAYGLARMMDRLPQYLCEKMQGQVQFASELFTNIYVYDGDGGTDRTLVLQDLWIGSFNLTIDIFVRNTTVVISLFERNYAALAIFDPIRKVLDQLKQVGEFKEVKKGLEHDRDQYTCTQTLPDAEHYAVQFVKDFVTAAKAINLKALRP